MITGITNSKLNASEPITVATPKLLLLINAEKKHSIKNWMEFSKLNTIGL